MGGGNPFKRKSGGGGSMSGAANSVVEKEKSISTTSGSKGIGMGQAGQEEDTAKKDKKKSDTLSKKKFGTRGAAIPLQSTATISGDPSTKGVQI